MDSVLREKTKMKNRLLSEEMLLAIKDALVKNAARDLVQYIDAQLHRDPVVDDGRHREYEIEVPAQFAVMIADVLGIAGDGPSEPKVYCNQQIEVLRQQWRRVIS